MTIMRWATVGSLSDPIFIVSTLLFAAGIVLIATRSATAYLAAEYGAIFGFVYGVIVWGSVGYYFGFDGQAKLLFAGSAILDGIVLCTILQLGLARRQRQGGGAAG